MFKDNKLIETWMMEVSEATEELKSVDELAFVSPSALIRFVGDDGSGRPSENEIQTALNLRSRN